METLFSVLHVVTAVFIVGPMAVLPMVAMRDVRAGHGAQVGHASRMTFSFSLASLVVVFFGFALLGVSDPEYDLSITTPWILASLIIYAVALSVNLLIVVPTLDRAGKGLQDPQACESGRNGTGRNDYGRVAMSSGVVSVLLIAVVVLMVWKP